MLAFSGTANAMGLDTYPSEPTEAEASIAGLTLGGNDLIGLAESHAGSASDPGPNREAFSGSLGGSEIVDFGTGFTIPLDQLLQFGQVGALLSESTATDGRNGEAISGIAGADGGITLDGQDGDFGTASIDLLSLFEAAGVDGVTDIAVDQADFTFGLGGAWVEAVDGAFQDPDTVGGMGQYRVGDAKIVIHSPVIEQAADGISDAAGTLEQSANDLVNSTLGLSELLPGETSVSIETTLQQDVLDAVMLAPITTDDGLASIDLGAGTVTLGIGRIGGNDDGVIDRPVGINNQNPNTELIDDETYPFIASSVHDVIEKVLEVATDAAVESLQGMIINVAIDVPNLATAGWKMDLTGAVTEDFCTPNGIAGIATCTTINGVKATMGVVVAPLRALIADGNNPIYQAFTTIKTDMITVPIRAVVDPFLEIISQVVSLQINHQETQVCTPTGGGADVPSGVEVSALSLGLVGGAARLGFGNAGLRVDACGLAAVDPTLTASSPAPAGGETTITSGGWTPGAEVSLQLTDADGNPVGEPVVVTADGDGNVPADTQVPVPADATAGEYTVVGTSGEDEATGTLTVYAPSLDAQSPVAPGACSAITSGGWLPNAQVSLQLTDADGNPVGEPVVVTTDGDGNVPAGTCVEIPEGTTPGDYEIVGSDETGGEASSPVTVDDAALTPTLDASSPVPAGGESTVTSAGWTPATEVSLQLTGPLGNPVGDPVVVTTDADGNVPADTKVPVPADSTAGVYTVVGSDADGNEATDTVQVYAPSLDAQSPVAPGDCSAITSGGWLPNAEVTLQLTDADGNPVGGPVVVTTDADGNVPAGTCVEIPEGTTPGEYEIVGSDETGGEVTAPVVVEDAAVAPTLDATSPVAAGGSTTVTSAGWTPESEVSLQLTGPMGNPVGEPVVVTTDGDGNVPAGTTVPVPADATAGLYTVVGSDADGNEATDTVQVYAPSLEAETPVAPGDCSAITSGGWLPNTEVTLQLTDADGNPVGEPVVVTTDADGNVPAGTCVEIPEGTDPGEYEIVGSDETGGEVTAPVVVEDAAVAPVLTATSPVPAGGESTVTSTGWAPESEVSLQLTDADGNPVGDPVVVTTDGDGSTPLGTLVPVPADTTAGGYTVVGTSGDDEASAEVVVYAPTISATSPVPVGDATTVTSTGWLPSTEVSLQLTDGSGAPVGDPVVVTTDGDGNVPAATTVQVPADATPGDHSVVATDANGAEVSAPVEVTAAAGVPTLTATSPVPAGGETTVTSTGWAPESEVSLQLEDADGTSVGDPVVVTTDADGNVPADTTVPVPTDATAGTYTVVGTSGDDEASAPVAVYAPAISATSPVPAGGTTEVTSTGWLPSTEVSLQLTDGSGAPVGDPVVVTTDGDGNVPAATTIPVPADATPGDHSVVATDANGAEVSAPVEVTAATGAPTLTATSPVPAGGTTVVTSTGWDPESEVSLQLEDADGTPVGDPVVVTTDGDGATPADTSVLIPATATAGEYRVLGTGGDDEASAPVAVYAPSISATSPVPAGSSTAVTSTGWLPNEQVELQLVDGSGDEVGVGVEVTTDADGNVPAGTTVRVPATATPGGHVLHGTDANGVDVSAEVLVTAAAGPVCSDPKVTVTPSIASAGDTVTVTGTGFAAGSEATVQIFDADGKGLLHPPLTVTVGSDCGFTAQVKIPADTDPGDYTVVVTDGDGNTARADLKIRSSLVVTGMEPGLYVPLALLMLAAGAGALLVRRRASRMEGTARQ
ncbi:hypothetical protein D3248_14300 [Leucobacter zeae]|nr:hypothetical protein [Leucobacter zeae]